MELGLFGIDPLSRIAALGKGDWTGSLPELQRWTRLGSPEAYMKDFAKIRERAMGDWRQRWHWWHVPAILIAAGQGVIFGVAVEPLFKAPGIPRFLFGCADTK